MVDLVQRNFQPMMNMVPEVARKLFINENIPNHVGNSKLYEEYDVQRYGKLKKEGENSKKAQVGLGYTKTVTARRYSMEVDITWEMRTYAKETKVVSDFQNLSHFIPQRMELDATHRFTYANATTYTDLDGLTQTISTGDGLSLGNSAHLLAFSSVTYTNIVPNNPQFSQVPFESAKELAATQSFSNFGDKIVMPYNTVIIFDNPRYQRIAKQILSSSADVDAVQAGVTNVYKGAFDLVVLPLGATTATGAYDSTKINWWFYGAITGNTNGWQSYLAVFEEPNLRTPAKGNNGEDFSNDNWTFGVRGSWDIASLSARGMICSFAS
jgi:hypothetical protein